MIIGESNSDKDIREARIDSARRTAIKMSELMGEPLQYIDPFFELDERILARIHWTMNRRPKCCKPKEKK